MLARVDHALNTLYRYCGYAAAVFMVIIGVLVFLSIITRYFSVYVPGLTEYSGYSMAAASFLALAYTFNANGHIRVEILISRFNPKFRHIAEFWCLGIATWISVYFAWYMSKLMYISWKFEERSEGADAILIWKPQALVVIGSVILCIAVIHNLIKCLMNKDYEPR